VYCSSHARRLAASKIGGAATRAVVSPPSSQRRSVFGGQGQGCAAGAAGDGTKGVAKADERLGGGEPSGMDATRPSIWLRTRVRSASATSSSICGAVTSTVSCSLGKRAPGSRKNA
jgi:hypothetical protein